MNAILTYEKQQEIKAVSINNKSKFEQIIKEVEGLEIDKLLGSVFYQDIANNKNNYNDLLNGCSFTNCNGYIVSHNGLYFVIAYLSYANYIRESFVNDTFTGFVKKQRPDSEMISQGDLKNLEEKNKQIAYNSFELIKDYLNQNTESYPLWNCCNRKITSNSFKVYGIKKTMK